MSVRFARLNLRCIRGTEWNDDFVLRDQSSGDAIDISGVDEILLRARNDSGTIVFELRLTEDTLTLPSGGTDGKVGIRAGSALTNTLPAAGHELETYPYDTVLQRGAEWEAGTSGTLTVDPQISRPLDDA